MCVSYLGIIKLNYLNNCETNIFYLLCLPLLCKQQVLLVVVNHFILYRFLTKSLL